MTNDDVQVKKITINEEMSYGGENILTFRIDYPQFSSERFLRAVGRMNTLYKAEAMAFKRYCRNTLYKLSVQDFNYAIKNDFPVRPYDAVLTYQITYNDNCTVSLYFDRYEFTGGAHGNTKRYSDTWDLQKGRRITAYELFSPDVAAKEYILNTIYGIVSAQIKNGDDIYFDNFQENIEKSLNLNNFYLTENGIVLYFQQYEIGPYSSGIIEFTIPYSDGILNKPTCKI